LKSMATAGDPPGDHSEERFLDLDDKESVDRS
jgi:hypothetical protein